LSATKLIVLEDGGVLPPPPNLSQLVDKEYNVYERDINNKDGEYFHCYSVPVCL
jgi:hypothetical protein